MPDLPRASSITSTARQPGLLLTRARASPRLTLKASFPRRCRARGDARPRRARPRTPPRRLAPRGRDQSRPRRVRRIAQQTAQVAANSLASTHEMRAELKHARTAAPTRSTAAAARDRAWSRANEQVWRKRAEQLLALVRMGACGRSIRSPVAASPDPLAPENAAGVLRDGVRIGGGGQAQIGARSHLPLPSTSTRWRCLLALTSLLHTEARKSELAL
jgi:hypothetical protein